MFTFKWIFGFEVRLKPLKILFHRTYVWSGHWNTQSEPILLRSWAWYLSFTRISTKILHFWETKRMHFEISRQRVSNMIPKRIKMITATIIWDIRLYKVANRKWFEKLNVHQMKRHPNPSSKCVGVHSSAFGISNMMLLLSSIVLYCLSIVCVATSIDIIDQLTQQAYILLLHYTTHTAHNIVYYNISSYQWTFLFDTHTHARIAVEWANE